MLCVRLCIVYTYIPSDYDCWFLFFVVMIPTCSSAYLVVKSCLTLLCLALSKNRNNLLMKLSGSTWGASANTLWSSALSLCYSAAEYCAPVWSRSIDISQVDVQFISGTLRSTLLPWLPVLSNEERLPLTSWWRKSSNMIVGQSSLISLTHHWHDWHPGSHCGWTYNQLTSKVDGGITGSRLRAGGQLSPRAHSIERFPAAH